MSPASDGLGRTVRAAGVAGWPDNGRMRPMLASPTSFIPSGDEWVHEVKWDGMRVLVEAHAGDLRITSRTEREVTVAFPELAPLADEYDDLLLDGELVVFEHGRPSFAALAERFNVTRAEPARRLAAVSPATLIVFDLLRVLGTDLRDQPWSVRRATLERLELTGPRWQVPPTYTDGPALHAATREQGLEGIVSKRRTGRYTPGARSPDWLKSPHRSSTSVVIGGWRPETTGTGRLGAVLVGVPSRDPAAAPGTLQFRGRVGSGLAGRVGEMLRQRVQLLGTTNDPFVTPVPTVDADGTTWVRPEIVIDVESLGRSRDGRLRQPSFRGMRPDLTPADLLDEDPIEGRH